MWKSLLATLRNGTVKHLTNVWVRHQIVGDGFCERDCSTSMMVLPLPREADMVTVTPLQPMKPHGNEKVQTFHPPKNGNSSWAASPEKASTRTSVIKVSAMERTRKVCDSRTLGNKRFTSYTHPSNEWVDALREVSHLIVTLERRKYSTITSQNSAGAER